MCISYIQLISMNGNCEFYRSRAKIPFRLKQPGKNHDQLKKKIEKYENQLEVSTVNVKLL